MTWLYIYIGGAVLTWLYGVYALRRRGHNEREIVCRAIVVALVALAWPCAWPVILTIAFLGAKLK